MLLVFYVLSLVLCSLGKQLYHGERTYDPKSRTIYVTTDTDQVNMMVMGDWGGLPFYPYYSPFEKVTAKQMMKQASEEETDFVLALGDNFYYDGVVDEFDSRFKNTFENVFGDPTFLQVPWFVVGGNHDHYGNITGQIEYSKHSHRWNFPDLYYSIEVRTPSFNMTIVMIDTVVLCGNTLHDVEESDPAGNPDAEAVDSQIRFIESKLSNNPNPYVMVGGHFPVWSIAEHGPTQCLIDKLKPLLEKYQATAYLCGHDHNLQHIREPNSTVEYFLSGAVDVVDPSKKHSDSVPADWVKFHWADILGLGGYATIDAAKNEMILKFFSGTGHLLYKYAVNPRK